MKKLFLSLAITAVAVLSFADTVSVKPPASDPKKPKIVIFNVDQNGVSLGYVNDGVKGFGSVNEIGINNLFPKFSINTVTVAAIDGKTLYQGLDGTYRAYDKNGVAVVLQAGWKGLQLVGGIGTNYDHPFFFGAGVTFALPQKTTNPTAVIHLGSS